MERRVIALRGTVQGVGFRPFVYGLARGLSLGGWVRNQVGGVRIEVEGEPERLDLFLGRVLADPPPLARIEEWSTARQPVRGESAFYIDGSDAGVCGSVSITPDAAVCDACLAELFDPHDRRYRYPFLNCTNCGPRLTIVTGVPYDRERTTMAGFPMCRRCRAEYDDPSNRRFHAEPTACAECGPRLTVLNDDGSQRAAADPLAVFVEALRAERIGAVKGLGGYHLACAAGDASAVAQLRRRKHREEKPFALMVRDLAAAAQLCEIDDESRGLLLCTARPIVLMPKRAGADIAEAVAPGHPLLGVMLPYTPLHHLLMHDLGDMPLVMTSGNRSDEPIAYEEADAVERLRGIADLFLSHDRPIHVRCDDSVTRTIGGRESPVRRSRGYAPQPVALPMTCPSVVLAVGGQQKATFALGCGGSGILSHHMGDLDHFEAFTAFTRDIALYETLFRRRPALIAYDMHPGYASTRYALGRAKEEGLAAIPVQHHHAHLASCMAEHGLSGEVIGVTFDGTGFGADDTVWGGEFLTGGYKSFRREAHLRCVPLPGSERAVREPWRMAAAQLIDAEVESPAFEARQNHGELQIVRRMIERRLNAPLTSSAGRCFDAVAALAGVRDRASYEGQAAIELEALAASVACDGSYPFEIPGGSVSSPSPFVIDTRPLIQAIVADTAAGRNAAIVARRFHSTMVEIISAVCRRLRERTGLERVVLSGGVFMNALLAFESAERLQSEQFAVYRHRLVPPNDGGLSLGQLAVAMASLQAS